MRRRRSDRVRQDLAGMGDVPWIDLAELIATARWGPPSTWAYYGAHDFFSSDATHSRCAKCGEPFVAAAARVS